jgi:hypothetical protein
MKLKMSAITHVWQIAEFFDAMLIEELFRDELAVKT